VIISSYAKNTVCGVYTIGRLILQPCSYRRNGVIDTKYVAVATAELKNKVDKELLVPDPPIQIAKALLCRERLLPFPSSDDGKAEQEMPHAK
jgi:hypothetical protein